MNAAGRRAALAPLDPERPAARPRTPMAALLVALVAVGGCLDNTAPGNDREADLDPPAPAAPLATAAAIDGVDPGLLMPEIMTAADQGAIPDSASFCRFRMTRVGFPVVAYGSSAIVKLNGQLVELPRVTEGRYAADGVEITLRPLEDWSGDGLFEAELVLRLHGAPHESGFHGYGEC